MKKAPLIFFFLLISCCNFCFGQFLPDPRAKTGIAKIKLPLVIIDSMATEYSSLVIHPKNLKIVKTYEDSLELVPFGEKGEGGVVIAESVNKTTLWRLPAVLEYFKIPAQKQPLKVLVNKALINPNLFLADIERIERIEVVKQDAFALFLYSFNKNEEYLNIVTRKE